MIEYPLDENSKGTLESTKFKELRALKFFGGLPVYEAVPDFVGTEAETIIVSSSPPLICSFLASTWNCNRLSLPSASTTTTLTSKNGVASKLITSGTSTQTIAHGLAGTPFMGDFRVFMIPGGTYMYESMGSWSPTGQSAICNDNAVIGLATTAAIFFQNLASGNNYAIVTADDTNFNLAWTINHNDGLGYVYTIQWSATKQA